MNDFFITAKLRQGITKIEVQHITPPEQFMLGILLFTVDFYNGRNFTTCTLKLLNGNWFDHEVTSVHGFESQLYETEINNIGEAIARYMLVTDAGTLHLLIPFFPDPKMN